jgi:hypothetical protein
LRSAYHDARGEGWSVNHKKIQRLWREEGVRGTATTTTQNAWVPQQPPADSLYDGDLVVRLTHPADPTYPLPRDHAADVEMLLAYQGSWRRVGQWFGIDDGWPGVVAPTAAAVMGLHGDATEAAIWSETPPPSTSPPLIK